MATTVNQPTKNPTNKLSAAIVGSALAELMQAAVSVWMPEFSQPSLWTALSPVIVGLCGFIIKDDPNIIVNVGGK